MVTSFLSNGEPALREAPSRWALPNRSTSENDRGRDDLLSARLSLLGDGVLTHTSSLAIMRVDFGLMKEGCGKTGSEDCWDRAGRGDLAGFLFENSLSSRWERCEFAMALKTWESCIKMVFRKMCEKRDWGVGYPAVRTQKWFLSPQGCIQRAMAFMTEQGWRYGYVAEGI